MQIVSLGDNLPEISKPIFWEKIKNVINLLSAEFAHSMVRVDYVSLEDMTASPSFCLSQIMSANNFETINVIFIKLL